MTEPIDLTDEGNDTPQYVPKQGDESSKKRVVALAEGLIERLRVAEAPPPRKRVRTAVDGVDLPVPALNSDNSQRRGADVASAAKPAPEATPAQAHAQTQAAEAPNNLLAQLHAERLARMSEASKAALRSPLKAEPSKVDRPDRDGQSRGVEVGSTPSRPVVSSATTSQADRPQAQASSSSSARSVTVLTYNLWFAEEVALSSRMGAVGDIIEREGYPDLLLFQEVTQNIVLLFRQSLWFRRYHCSPVPTDKPYFTLLLARRDTVTLPAMQPWLEKDFDNSCMGRTILYTKASISGRPLVVGTSHLESPVGPGPQQMVAQRKEQLEVAVRELEAAAGPSGDVLFAGDLNWSEGRDGSIRLPPRWCDAWPSLVPQQPGFTYNPACNPMLTSRYKGSRLDRVLCRLSATAASGGGTAAAAAAAPSASSSGGRSGGWQLGSIKLVGTQALPGVTHEFRGKRLPVLPSDHFGIVVKLLPAEAAAAGAPSGNVLGGGGAGNSAAAATANGHGHGHSGARGSGGSGAAAASPSRPSEHAPVPSSAGGGGGAAAAHETAGHRSRERPAASSVPAATAARGAEAEGRRAGPSRAGQPGESPGRGEAAAGGRAGQQRQRPASSKPTAGTAGAAVPGRAPVMQVDLSAEDADDDVIVL